MIGPLLLIALATCFALGNTKHAPPTQLHWAGYHLRRHGGYLLIAAYCLCVVTVLGFSALTFLSLLLLLDDEYITVQPLWLPSLLAAGFLLLPSSRAILQHLRQVFERMLYFPLLPNAEESSLILQLMATPLRHEPTRAAPTRRLQRLSQSIQRWQRKPLKGLNHYFAQQEWQLIQQLTNTLKNDAGGDGPAAQQDNAAIALYYCYRFIARYVSTAETEQRKKWLLQLGFSAH